MWKAVFSLGEEPDKEGELDLEEQLEEYEELQEEVSKVEFLLS